MAAKPRARFDYTMGKTCIDCGGPLCNAAKKARCRLCLCRDNSMAGYHCRSTDWVQDDLGCFVRQHGDV